MKILALGAHPDDVEFGAAGLLIKEKKNGAEVKIVICSLGEAGTNGTPEDRKAEAEAAAKYIGAEFEYIPMDGDCHLVNEPKNRVKIAEIIRIWKPDVVLAPSQSKNQHPDHLAVSEIARNAARYARYAGLAELKNLPTHAVEAVYYYPSSAEMDEKPDIVIDVSAEYDQWVETMNLHKSQMRTREYINLVSSKAQYIGATIGTAYAVPLWTNDPVSVDSLGKLGSSRKYR